MLQYGISDTDISKHTESGTRSLLNAVYSIKNFAIREYLNTFYSINQNGTETEADLGKDGMRV
jgi:hypothetical protein